MPDTPSAALRLLRLLGAALLLCLLCSLAFALSLAFNHQVSLSRRAMNAAMYEAQAYLGQRESLLEHLGRGLLPLAARPALEQTLILARATPGPALLPLGDGRQGLLLSPRDFAELRERRLGLLLIGPGGPGDVQRLNASGGPEAPLPAGVLRALRQAGTDGGVRWLADPADPQRRLFLLQRVGDADNWLGLEICGADLDAALRRPEAGDYLLLDRQGIPVLGDWHGATALASLRGQGEGDGFDFASDGLLPQCVLLRKHLGAARWELVYCLGLGRLLAELWPLPLAALAILLVVGLLLRRLERRFERRLIRPARRRLAALRESEAFSRAVIQASPVALCVLRRLDASVVLQNPQARRWLGGGRMIARHGERWIARAFGGDGGAACEELASDQGRYLQLSYTPTRYKGEDVLFCAFSDISARTRAEAELARAKRLADAANQAKTVFLATMSHEIRTPLYGVLGTLELLERTRLDAQQSAYLETIQRSSGILLRLISDVLDVSRIEAGQLLLELVEFSPLELTEEVLQTFAAAARAKGLQLFACIDSRLPALARGDAVRIRQVLGNLLSNAIKFTDNGRILLRLRVQTREGARLWLLWQVLDSGIGIGSEDQRRLFEPFYQVGGSARRVGGTGLGLSICQRLTRLMHGRLSLVSELGLGSSFTL
ncbi:ATP-binding protein, partial [Pseudomonas citronellolis]|uniref:ATP-binding protein n=1 Tax=Pseudomonas citronellolis TaxID=53408 RepID=UPI0023E3A495